MQLFIRVSYGLFECTVCYKRAELTQQNYFSTHYFICIYDDGEWYIGDFKNDTRHGQGTCIYQSGEKYVGEWKENFKNGKGIEFKADGSQKKIRQVERW